MSGLAQYVAEPYTAALSQLAQGIKADVVAMAATAVGRDLLPRVAGRLKAAMASDVMGFEGSGGAAGMARGQSQVELSDERTAEGLHTRLRYTVQASVAGKLGQVGGRMIDAAAKQMADQFFGAFQAHVAPAAASAAPGSAAQSAAKGSSVSFLSDRWFSAEVPKCPCSPEKTCLAKRMGDTWIWQSSQHRFRLAQ